MIDYMPAGAWPSEDEPGANAPVPPDDVFETGAAVCSEIRLYLAGRMHQLRRGQVLELVSGDADARAEIPDWCALRGYPLLRVEDDDRGRRHYFIRKPASVGDNTS